MDEKHSFLGDIVSLTKPKITLMAVLVAWAGVLHAGKDFAALQVALLLLGIGALVSGSSALNMYFERELDGKMARTKSRPLPAGRIDAWWAVLIGVLCSVAAGVLLSLASNVATVTLGLLSLVVYVFCYTPLKQKSWTALIVGSVPGAMPVALGYVALANRLDEKALALFLWAFLWQIPHFLAISIFREKEYSAAGFPLLSSKFGVTCAKWVLLATSWLLVLSTVALHYAGLMPLAYFWIAMVMGALFLAVCHVGAFSSNTFEWARRAFRASLLYQSALFMVLIVGAMI